MLQRVWALLIKEFLAVLKDKRSRVVLVVPPLIQTLVFGYAATFDLNDLSMALYNEDPGVAARALVADFEGSPHFHVTHTITRQEQIETLIDSREVLLVLHIAPDFSRELVAGRSGSVQLIVDGRNSNTAQGALNYANEIVLRFNREWNAANGLRALPAHIESRAWFNANLLSRWFIVSGLIGTLIMLVVMNVTAMSVAREREQGTFDQLLVTPLTPLDILLGKSLPGLIIGVVEATLMVLIVVYWFDVPLRGSLWTLYAGVVLFLFSAIGAGLLISSLATTMQQALMGSFLFMVPSIILSGFATPIANMPEPVQMLTLIDPLRYFMVVLRGVFVEGASFSLMLPQLWPMALLGLVSLSFSAWLFRHRLN